MRQALALSVLCSFLAACGGGSPGGGSIMPSSPSGIRANDGATALPGGDGATALPGATVACPTQQSVAEARCTVALNVKFPPLSSVASGDLVPGLHPADLQARYALPARSGGTVAIVDAYDDPLAESDLNVYRGIFGMSACTSSNGCFKKVDQNGGSAIPATNNAWTQEISLDLDMVSAACPSCTILLIEAKSASIADLAAAVDTAAKLGARAISNSYYAVEWSSEKAEDVHYFHQGIPVVASSGDQPYPYYPAASPNVVSVGGTTLLQSGSSFSETGWKYGGRGCSKFEARPSWQNGLTSCTTRAAVDIAAEADPATGVAMYDSQAGGWLVAGGTSIGSPLVAAAYALAANGAPVSYAYAHASAFHLLSTSRFDSATGLGSPNGLGGL